MSDINVRKLNESTVFIACESPQILRDINSLFTVFADNYRWSPKFKAGIWDGKLKFFTFQHQLPIGLVPKLYEFAKEGNYSIEKNYNDEVILSKEEFMKFISSLNLPMEPREFQLQASYDAITQTKLSIDSSTGSGKSLILYIIVRWMLSNRIKTILIVPSVALVEQAFGDFLDYGWEDVEKYCCRIYGGQKRLMEKPVIISTWQSLYTDLSLFQEYKTLVIDECFISTTKVNIENGYTSIDKINIGDKVYSLNLDTNQKELKEVVKIYKNATLSTHLIEIEIENGITIKCTPNHKFYIKKDNMFIFKKASELTEQDELVEF